MKKNIQINLFGTLYNIDDDAYQLLERYLDSMKNYFMHQDGGEEIADDIEHRVAELLWQRKQMGMEAVNIETIKEIISQIGNPQQIDAESDNGSDASDDYVTAEEVSSDDDNANTHSSAHTTSANMRHLYRNPDDKMVGGVCSGLAAYVGKGDVTLWRLAFVLLPFIFESASKVFHLYVGGFWLLPIAYVLLWFIIPEARTAEDRLRMKGCEVTPENINEQIISDSTPDKPTRHASTSNNGGCLRALLFFFIILCCLPAIFVIIAMLIVALFSICVTIGAATHLFTPFFATDLGISDTFFSNYGWLVTTGSIAGLFAVIIPLYLIIKRMTGRPFGRHTVPMLMIIWLLMTAWALFSLIACGSSFHRYFDPSTWSSHFSINTVDSIAPTQADTTDTMEELVDSAAIDLWSE